MRNAVLVYGFGDVRIWVEFCCGVHCCLGSGWFRTVYRCLCFFLDEGWGAEGKRGEGEVFIRYPYSTQLASICEHDCY